MATQTQLYSARIAGAELPRDGSPILISNYTVEPVNRANRDYGINLNGMGASFKQVNWLSENGAITPAMLDLLVPQDARKPLRADKTFAWTNPNSDYAEGLRALIWLFRGRERSVLNSYWGPCDRISYWGSLLGSVAEGAGRLKIGGVDYFVQPAVAQRGEDLWETQLYAKESVLVNFSAQNVSRIAAFTQPEEPSKQWLRSEVERFEKNEGLKERQVRDAYKSLQGDIWKSYWVRSSEILAWPIYLSRK